MTHTEKLAIIRKEINEGKRPSKPPDAPYQRHHSKAPLPSRVRKCIHLGDKVLGTPCGSPLKHCNLHGCKVSAITGCSEASRCCQSCPDYVPVEFPTRNYTPISLRHLLYHIFPVRDSIAWRRGISQLRMRWGQFTGRKIIAVAVGSTTISASELRPFFPSDCEIIEVPNSPSLREVTTWEPLWNRILPVASPSDAVFYAHAKGVTRKCDPGNTCQWWASCMYSIMLDHPTLVAQQLQKYPITGAFKKVGYGFGGSSSSWHYSGSFFWARVDDISTRKIETIPRQWWGNEAWPGIAYQPFEAGCLFKTGTVPELDLYSPKRWMQLRQDYARWIAENPPYKDG